MTDLSPDVQALLDESYKSDLTEEESEELLLLCGHGIGKKLSPAAQAVLQAACIHHGLFNEEIVQRRRNIAAALRAAADQVVPEGYTQAYDCCLEIMGEIREELLAIAAELEGNA